MYILVYDHEMLSVHANKTVNLWLEIDGLVKTNRFFSFTRTCSQANVIYQHWNMAFKVTFFIKDVGSYTTIDSCSVSVACKMILNCLKHDKASKWSYVLCLL